MARWYWFLAAIVLPAIASACNDDTIQDVPEDICASGQQWIGGKRGDPRMYPGRDCVGCHLDNDGPELMFGGTVYAYLEGDFRRAKLTPPSGVDCFGLPGVTVKITGSDEQEFVATTNEAGNFFVEGKATDLVKTFRAEVTYTDPVKGPSTTPMPSTRPSYGGCARCHSVDATRYPDPMASMEGISKDEYVSPAGSGVGVPGALNLPPAP